MTVDESMIFNYIDDENPYYYTINSVESIVHNGNLVMVISVLHDNNEKKKIMVASIPVRGNPVKSNKVIPFRRTVTFKKIDSMIFDNKNSVVLSKIDEKHLTFSFLYKGKDKTIRIGNILISKNLEPVS